MICRILRSPTSRITLHGPLPVWGTCEEYTAAIPKTPCPGARARGIRRQAPGNCGKRRLLRGHAPSGQLALEVELPRGRGFAAWHRPEDLELEPVWILGVQRQADTVVRGADQRTRLGQPPPRAHQIGDVGDLPGGVVHSRHALVWPWEARLLE